MDRALHLVEHRVVGSAESTGIMSEFKLQFISQGSKIKLHYASPKDDGGGGAALGAADEDELVVGDARLHDLEEEKGGLRMRHIVSAGNGVVFHGSFINQCFRGEIN